MEAHPEYILDLRSPAGGSFLVCANKYGVYLHNITYEQTVEATL